MDRLRLPIPLDDVAHRRHLAMACNRHSQAPHERCFAGARERRRELEKDIEKVKTILSDGAGRARVVARETLGEIYEVIGLWNKLSTE